MSGTPLLTTRRAFAVLGLVGIVAACATSRPAPPEPLGRNLAVLPPNNRTGDTLLVAGSSLIDRYVRHAARVTVADVLASEARLQLKDKGFEVADPQAVETALKGRVPMSPESAVDLAAQSGLKNLVLYLEIRRWEPDAPIHARFVIVALAASVVDPATRQVLWYEERRAAPVATPGVVTIESAYVIAARKVIREVLAPLQPLAPTQPQAPTR